jgi:uncharacterized membrane protein
MFDHLYRKRLKQDLEHWVDKGWVTPQGAGQILGSLSSGDGRSRLPMVLGGIGITCIALALAAFIAANWDGIPRALKLAGIAICVLGSHGLAAWASASGRKGVSDLATAFATLVFVGGMALVGQIFHLPSDWAGGAFLICLGALAAAWITGSKSSLIVAAAAAIIWQTNRPDIGNAGLVETLIGFGLLLAVFIHPVLHPNRLSRWAATLLLLLTYGRWLVDAAEALDWNDKLAIAAASLGFTGLAACMAQLGQIGDLAVKWSGSYPQRSHGRWLMLSSIQDAGVALLSLLLTLVLIGQSEVDSAPVLAALIKLPVAITFLPALALCATGFLLSFKTGKARTFFAAVLLVMVAVLAPLPFDSVVLTAAFSLAGLIAISAAGTLYGNSFWTLCGYAGLTACVLWLLDVTIGSLLGQSVFFLVAGLVLLVLAYAVTRMLRRSAHKAQETGS